jgi:hypothetical protein
MKLNHAASLDLFLASKIPIISEIVHTWSEIPASIAGVTRKL